MRKSGGKPGGRTFTAAAPEPHLQEWHEELGNRWRHGGFPTEWRLELFGGKSFRFWCCFGSELGDGLGIGGCLGGLCFHRLSLVDIVRRSGREERLVSVVVLGGVGRAEAELGGRRMIIRRPGGEQMGEECHLWHPLWRDWWARKAPREKFLVRTLWSDQAVAVALQGAGLGAWTL